MSSKKFKFISPGVFLNEIDNSQLPAEPRDIGPLVIGRTLKGPAMRPVRVDSFSEFVNVFGEPHPGGENDDVWRNGNTLAPTYASYAAQAWLKNQSTINVVRLLGKEHTNKTAGSGEAGWKLDNTIGSASATSDSPKSAYTEHGKPGSQTDIGSAYGLWLFPTELSMSFGDGVAGWGAGAIQSTLAYRQQMTASGMLAAIWYVNDGGIGLTGKGTDNVTYTYSKAGFIQSDNSANWQGTLSGSNTSKTVTFNFTETNKNFIRKVFNTNPTLTNTSITNTNAQEIYWLGETFESFLGDSDPLGNTYITSEVTGVVNPTVGHDDAFSGSAVNPFGVTASYFGVIGAIHANNESGAAYSHASRQITMTDGVTGWVMAQDMSTETDKYDPRDMQKLFRFHGLNHGAWAQENIKVSVANVRYSQDTFSKYGSFDILVRKISDTDRAPVVLERFNNCNLNPNSLNYVALKVGDRYVEFDTENRRLIEKGTYANRSRYLRIEMNVDVDDGTTNEELLPFGVHGPTKYKDFNWVSGSGYVTTASLTYVPVERKDSTGGNGNGVMAVFGPAVGAEGTQTNTIAHRPSTVNGHPGLISASFGKTAAITAKTGLQKGCFIGADGGTDHHGASAFQFKFPKFRARKNATSDGLSSVKQAYFGAYTGKSETNNQFDPCVKDLVRSKAAAVSQQGIDNYTEYAWVFSLDDISASVDGDYHWKAGNRVSGTAVTTSSYKDILDKDINSFTAVFYGGTDGFNVKEVEPLRSGLLHNATTAPTEKNSYVYNTYKEAIDIVKDPEEIEYNLVTIPALAHEPLTTHLLETVESRGDALAVIDLKGDFQPSYEGQGTSKGKKYGSVKDVVTNLKARQLNSSYGCAYYPWVQVRDTIRGNMLYMPPSVVAVGAMSYTDRIKAPWFAPAGFNRGGLSQGIAGLPVLAVTDKLTSKDRDDLYEANINPIASFPSEGIVIFGQKTLQVTRSALDRINVRRLLLFVKKGISRISSDMLFEPNVQETWDRFTNRANPFLADVKARFGLTDYKLVLDKTTTTPDLVDRNIMYAKVFLKPARAIEFIAVDFVITNTGAAFED